MVLSILVAIISAPALLGTQEAIRQSQSKEKREEHRARRCNLIATCVKSSMRSREINGRPIVLKDGKLWIDTGTSDGAPFGHPYAGYYLPYPDTKYEGLVTTITDIAPIMNWVYIDKDTYEVKYGVRLDAQPNLTGPFDCTRQDRRLTFDGWEGFCAVEVFPTLWALYFDKDDDGLRSKVAPGTRVLEIELSRKEKRWKKDGEERQKDQTTKREVETKEDSPVDNPVTAQPVLNPPGVGVPNAEKVQEPLKPFGLPKSLFSDPPRPIFFGQEMLPPRTPPPAYEMDSAVDPPPVAEIKLPAAEPEVPLHGENITPLSPPAQQPQAPLPVRTPQWAQAASQPRQESQSAQKSGSPVELFQTPQRGPLAPSRNEANESPPRSESYKPPLAPAPLRVTPPADRRPTPKLNRQSGTRAIAQAQMFEAWAQGQAPTSESSRKSTTPPRPLSNATSVSNYSDPPKIDEEDVFLIYKEPDPSTLPLTAAPKLEKVQVESDTPFTVADPAVFARLSSGSSTTSDPAVIKDKPIGEPPIRNKSSSKSISANRTSRKPLPPVPDLRRGDGQGRSSPDRGPPNRRQASVSERSRAVSPEQPRRTRPGPSISQSRTTTRNPTRAPSLREPPTLRERNDGASSQRSGSSTAQPQTDRSPRSSPRPPIARTNTAPVRDRAERSRTTSNLYREIDDLVNSARSRSNTVDSNGSSTRRNEARADERQPPLRRTVTARERPRNEGGRSTNDRVRDVGRGPARRGEREPMERK